MGKAAFMASALVANEYRGCWLMLPATFDQVSFKGKRTNKLSTVIYKGVKEKSRCSLFISL